MAVSGMWMLVVFYAIVYALVNEWSTDFFIALAMLGTVAFVTSS